MINIFILKCNLNTCRKKHKEIADKKPDPRLRQDSNPRLPEATSTQFDNKATKVHVRSETDFMYYVLCDRK